MKIIRIEICESTLYMIVITAILSTILAIVWVGSHYYTQRIEAAFENDYEKEALPGMNSPSWVKVKI